mmetsp:Transcript_11125/g.11210  ORF Transcript_11125/g.11210 Transcript_11125/m.11210 type:complete len:107 (-) Transcript_11125:757-1077(-)
MIGLQLLKRVRDLHSIGIIHNDIKPENILVEYNFNLTKMAPKIFLIDFGLASFIENSKQENLSSRRKSHSTGSNYYCSPFSHLLKPSCARDDLISVLYVLIHLLNG